MNKQTYLAKLAQLLAPLPEQERQDALNYYEEYFDAAGPEAEDATAAELGDPADAARKILEGEGLMLDSAQAAAGESSDASDTAQDAAPQPTGENPPTTKPELHGPAAIPPVLGVLLALAAVLVVVCVLLIGFFGVRSSSIANTAETFVVSAVEPLAVYVFTVQGDAGGAGVNHDGQAAVINVQHGILRGDAVKGHIHCVRVVIIHRIGGTLGGGAAFLNVFTVGGLGGGVSVLRLLDSRDNESFGGVGNRTAAHAEKADQ